jgi:hypothetical protein
MATSDVVTCFKVLINETSVVLLDINCICVNCYVWLYQRKQFNLLYCLVFVHIYVLYLIHHGKLKREMYYAVKPL